MFTVPDYLEVLTDMIDRHQALLDNVIPKEDEEARKECQFEIDVMKELRERVHDSYVSISAMQRIKVH